MNDAGSDHELPVPTELISLQRMPQQAAAVTPMDDWTGTTDRRERRKMQNRLNQRARRRRQTEQEWPPGPIMSDEGLQSGPPTEFPLVAASTAETERQPISDEAATDHDEETEFEGIEEIRLSESATKSYHYFEELAYRYYLMGSPRTDLIMSLSQLNFIRSLLSNVEIMNLSLERMEDDDSISPFNMAGPRPAVDFESSSLPLSLRPTQLQCTVPHHPWIDLIPVPQLRDNIFQMGLDLIDEERLCHDLRGYRNDRNERTGVLVWRGPCDASGWEVSEAFMMSWGWTIKGCLDIMRSTNYWRTQRGEKPLFRIES
ncbi:hypothetical protein Egran_03257 [Elaphomyces granulatus]|uniref:BZIP domain-containing protein n=1 Tax=Elaphomyces granulatus TaxID=519963 RepID=A0A232LXT5_9EURO|nr:hypothetical protein Egran_03257 [Elaphomyces granulatus]